MKTDTAEKIVEYIRDKKQASAKEMVDYLGISRQAVFKQLGKLLKQDVLVRLGKPPKVFYVLKVEKEGKSATLAIDEGIRDVINENFIVITPSGEKREGWEGFSYWCQKRNQDIEKMAEVYVKTLYKYNAFRIDGLIDGTAKMKNTFKSVYLDKLLYLDFYSLEIFGKTKLGQLLLYAKLSQDKKLMRELIDSVKSKIEKVISEYEIDGVGFIPPTVKREVQFMKELENNLKLAMRKISLVKIKTDVAVPQKTLGKLEDRVENARATIVVDEKNTFKNILLIDDAVGSGATFNEVSAKIKNQKLVSGKVIGLAITGSFKGFDVISEV